MNKDTIEILKTGNGWKMKVFLTLCLLLVFFGCTTTQPVHTKIKIIDGFLASDISITDVSSWTNDSNLLEVQVTGFNHKASYKKLEYRIQWLDSNGLILNTILSRWTKFPAFENSEFRFKAIAPEKKASDYRILIRKGD